MLLDVCLGTKSAWKILFVLAEAPGKAVSRKEIQKLTKIGNKVLTKFLIVLEKFGMVIADKIGKTYYYRLDMNSQFTGKIIEIIREEKRELNNPDFEVLNVVREFVYELTNTNLPNIKSVILFGSYAKRTYHKESDIDIAIITGGKDVNEELLTTEICDGIKKRFKKQIQPHYFTEKEFKEQKNKLIQEIIKDGLRLM